MRILTKKLVLILMAAVVAANFAIWNLLGRGLIEKSPEMMVPGPKEMPGWNQRRKGAVEAGDVAKGVPGISENLLLDWRFKGGYVSNFRKGRSSVFFGVVKFPSIDGARRLWRAIANLRKAENIYLKYSASVGDESLGFHLRSRVDMVIFRKSNIYAIVLVKGPRISISESLPYARILEEKIR